MADTHNQRPSDWPRLFAIAGDLIDQIDANTGGYPFGWSFGGGTAMMIQIGHRESHDIDIFIDDPQILGFLDPGKVDLRFRQAPADYRGDGARFQKFTFDGVGEIDFIISGHLTEVPFRVQTIEGREVKLETLGEIVAKKIYHRGSEAKPRDIFDIAAAARHHRDEIRAALRQFPSAVGATLERLEKLNPEFVAEGISHLMVLPEYKNLVPDSLDIAKAVLREATA